MNINWRRKRAMDEFEIILGKKYRDNLHGIEGVAVSTHHYLHGCTRVTLQWVVDGDIKTEAFDAPALTEVETERPVTSRRTGGDGRAVPGPRS